MVTKTEIFEVADRMVANGRVPKNREIRDELANGGSLEDVSPLFKQWREERRYLPPIAALNLSKTDAAALAKSVLTLRASFEASNQTKGATANGPRSADVCDETAALLMAEIGELRDDIARFRTEASKGRTSQVAQGPLKPVRGPGERAKGVYSATQRFFWNAVMREIYGILQDGPMSSTRILELIHPDTFLLVQMLGNEPLNEPELVWQMRQRKRKGYYFLEPNDRIFERGGKTKGDPIYSSSDTANR